MKLQLSKILEEHSWKGKKIIVAVSGGSDSMALAAILRASDVSIVVAHCNFELRDTDSDNDEKLVVSWCAENNIACHVKHFETRKILEANGGNLQDTARNLRYAWFEELRNVLNFDYIATAHHKQDSVETMLMNFFRGTGIAGMHGILQQQNKIIRPLLSFSKEALKEYITVNNIPWREDSSNAKEDYARNAIRHQLFPVLENLFPNVMENLAGNTKRFAEVEILYREGLEKHTRKLTEQRQKDYYIPVLKLNKLKPVLQTVLRELLQPFSFSAAQLSDIAHLLEAESGKYVASATHKIIRNRDFLIVTPNVEAKSTFILIEKGDASIVTDTFSLSLKEKHFISSDIDALKSLESSELVVDMDKIEFPLVLRPKRTGDYFYPLGTNSKKKKISKYLIEQKVPLHEKENVWVLESNKKIIWIMGRRADDRFKAGPATSKVLYAKIKVK